MTWTEKPPTTADWYWYRLQEGSEPVPLHLKQGDGAIITGTGKHVDRMRGQWSDEPIPKPS
jgi:hypothetical protein